MSTQRVRGLAVTLIMLLAAIGLAGCSSHADHSGAEHVDHETDHDTDYATFASYAPDDVKTQEFVMGPYDLPSGGLMQMPGGAPRLNMKSSVWVVGYDTQILDATGADMHDSFHCHTMMRALYTDDWLGWIKERDSRDIVPFKGLFSDGHTPHLAAPDGFGIYMDQQDPIMLVPMFNNRTDAPLKAQMRISYDYVDPDKLRKPLRPLYSAIQSVQLPHLYDVAPGIDSRTKDFQFPYEGTIHVMGVHIHPYGESIELYNVSKGERVWKAIGNRRPDGTLISMPTYSDAEGYAFAPEETYRLTVTYDNPTDVDQDAMGGVFMFFSTPDDRMPRADGAAAVMTEAEKIALQEEPACHDE